MATRAIISDKRELVNRDLVQWVFNLRRFFAPLGIIYITSVIGLIQQDGHTISLLDFKPSNFVWGAMTLYVLNGLLDLFNKWSGQIRYQNGTRTVVQEG